jgi:site-specific recombinase XerD
MATDLVTSGQAFIEKLTDHEAAFLAASMAKNTIITYQASWTHFTTWCAKHHFEALPATVDTVCTYLSQQAAVGSKVSTLVMRLTAIRHAHSRFGYDSPTHEWKVRALSDQVGSAE